MRRQEEEAFIGLGSNLGDRVANVEAAFAAIAALPGTRLAARSSLYETAPVAAAGGDYVNAVARVRTTLAPLDLLHALQAIEAGAGRLRPYPNAPRTLDLDLLLYGDLELDGAELLLPHPRLHERAFVLEPLLEIAPELGLRGEPLAGLRARLGPQRIAKLDR
ncbi:MAG: 2-amino-4-hydroxy-6-hydroxymethyldihydropteridine diphosphokinase [Burkholderiales bacterium]|nr:2-amino-4-hydroxy-6-hydroxymethyldihydropteridine diphosphokinase [Burkholderiales bacterium]